MPDAPGNRDLQAATARGRLLYAILDRVGRENICILHGHEVMPDEIPSDVDAIVSPLGLRRVLGARFPGWHLVQCLCHERGNYYFVYCALHERSGNAPEFLALDVGLDCRRDGCVFYGGQEVLARAVCNRAGIPATPPALEFAYYMTKEIGKLAISRRHWDHLLDLWARDPTGCEAELRRWFPRSATDLITNAVRASDFAAVSSRTASLRRALRRHMFAMRPLSYTGYYLHEMRRALLRMRRPTGLVVAVLGADGAGKSTLIANLQEVWRHAFRRSRSFHQRPHWGRDTSTSAPVDRPHAKGARGRFLSALKMVQWSLDYSVGYLVAVLPLKVRSHLVLFDRYATDILVDPLRYRYGGPRWLATAMAHAAVRPDVCLILDTPPDSLACRKAEVSDAERVRQATAYRRLSRVLPHAHLLDAGQSERDVARDASRLLARYLSARLHRDLRCIVRP